MKRLWLFLFVLLLPLAAMQAQDRIDPKSPELATLPELGRMVGSKPNYATGYAIDVNPLGDVNNDKLADWCVRTYRSGTGLPNPPVELLLYKGIKGGLPSVDSGQRIGPSELASSTRFLAVGDWNADIYRDIVVRIELAGDTSGGNTEGYNVGTVVVFWGGPLGYSLNDTTRLENGAQTWFGPLLCVSYDADQDGVDELVMSAAAGLTNGKLVNNPGLMIFRGHHGQRWGLDDVARSADWGWWNPPKFKHLYIIDQNCDQVPDLVMAWDYEQTEVTGQLSILYGSPIGGFPDTTRVVTLDLKPVNGHNALLLDITGDGTPELLVVSIDEMLHIYAGEPGVRLLEQFGTGNDPPDSEHGRKYRRPWAELPLPYKLDNAFALSGARLLLNLGDAGLNGSNDIWVYVYPFIVAYSTGKNGECLDSLFDGIIYPAGGPPLTTVVLGDIDGTGVPTIAIGSDLANLVQFVKPTKDVREDYCVLRDPLHGDGIRCGNTSDVDGAGVREREGATLQLQAVPNPASDEVQVRWSGGAITGTAKIIVHDALGRTIVESTSSATDARATLDCSEWTAGSYFISLTIGEQMVTTQLQIRR